MRETLTGEQPDVQTQLDDHAAAQPILSKPLNTPNSNPPLSEGESKVMELRKGGFADDEITDWKSQVQAELVKGGFTDNEVKEYWGVHPNPDTAPIKDYVNGNLKIYFDATKDKSPINGNGQPKHQNEAKSFLEAFSAGTQTSVSSLMVHAPDTVMPEHASTAMRIAEMTGQAIGDIPWMAAGAILGGAAGTMAGGAAGSVVPVVGNVAGAAAGGIAGTMAGSQALPMAMRKFYMDMYEKGMAKDGGDLLARTAAIAWEGIKGGAIGVATGGVGGAAGGKVAGFAEKNVANALLRNTAPTAATLGSELVTMTTVASAFEGKLPSADDFLIGGAVIGGFHAANVVAPKFRALYANRGEMPAEVITRANTDVIFKQDLLSHNPDVPLEAQPTNAKGELLPREEGAKLPLTDAEFEAGARAPIELKAGTESEGGSIPDKGDDFRTVEVNEILSKVGGATKIAKFGESSFRANYVDATDNLKTAINEAAKRGADITPEENGYIEGRLFRGGYDRSQQLMFEKGFPDQEGKAIPGNEGLDQVYKDLPKMPDGKSPDYAGYVAFAVAKRALDQASQGKTPYEGFSPAVAEAVVNQGKAVRGDGKPNFEDIDIRRNKVKADGLKYAKDSGLFSERQLEEILKANESHISFGRVMDPDAWEGDQKQTGKGDLKKIVGSEREILDPLFQDRLNMAALYKRAWLNKVKTTLVDNLERGGLVGIDGLGDGTGEYLRKVEAKPDKAANKALAAELKKNGVDFSEDTVNVLREARTKAGPDEIVVFRDGKAEVYKGAPGVVESLKALEGMPNAVDPLLSTLRIFAQGLRTGVTGAPEFMVRHIVRMGQLAGVYSKTGMFPVIGPLRYLPEYVRGSLNPEGRIGRLQIAGKTFAQESAALDEWVHTGGGSGQRVDLKKAYGKERIAETEAATGFGRYWNTIKTPLDWAHTAITFADGLTRFAEAKRLREQGKGPKEAAFGGREVIEDYAKRGLNTGAFHMLRSMTAFSGATINSIDTFVMHMKENPAARMKLGMVMAGGAMIYAVNRDDKVIEKLPDSDKDNNWIFNVTRWTDPTYVNDGNHPAVLVRQPKPWWVGVLFASGTEHVLQQALADEQHKTPEHMWSHWGHSIVEHLVPPVIPTFAGPMIEQARNKKTYSGMDLVPRSTEKLLPMLKYQPYTTETAKVLGKLVGYAPAIANAGGEAPFGSPAVIENYIAGYTGTLGMAALKASDMLIQQVGFVAGKEPKASHWTDTPFVSGFFSRYPNGREQDIQDFYDNVDATGQQIASVRALAKRGDIAAAQSLANSNPDLMVNLTGASKALALQRKLLQNVQAAKLPPDEKRQMVDALLFKMVGIAQDANKQMEQFRKIIKNPKQADQNATPPGNSGPPAGEEGE